MLVQMSPGVTRSPSPRFLLYTGTHKSEVMSAQVGTCLLRLRSAARLQDGSAHDLA